jgi:predicted alpha/beta superfamily hydrolase
LSLFSSLSLFLSFSLSLLIFFRFSLLALHSTDSKDPQYGGGRGDQYLDFLESTVLPLIKKTYRVQIDSAANLGILGSSLGGLISCYAGWTRSKVYGKIGCMSSSFVSVVSKRKKNKEKK